LSRDAQLLEFARSVVVAARRTWGDGMVPEPAAPFDPLLLYTETHYALAAALLFLCREREESWLDVADSRLTLWERANHPVTFFQALAVCLTAILLERSGEDHTGLRSVIRRLLDRTREHRHVAFQQWCGNNAYLQQVAVDTILLPVARGQQVTEEGRKLMLREFRRYVTPEGFFFDLPRDGRMHELLLPPTYIMKMLFLAGVCHEMDPAEDFALLVRSGMAAVLPLLANDGTLSYFGRTDNSPFAAGLAIFNLRKAAALDPERSREYQDACERAERYYRTFPRTVEGMLQCNRFGDGASESDLIRSRDGYAYARQYSLASCAYALLGCYWFPVRDEVQRPAELASGAQWTVAHSKDLGVVRMAGPHSELLVRTRSEITSRDRRYLGPTILRLQVDGRLLIGAISRTISTDRVAQDQRPSARSKRLVDLFRYRFRNGDDQIDGSSVGFLPVIRHGTTDYLPYEPTVAELSPTWLRVRYRMLRLRARGYHPCVLELVALVHQNVPGLKPRRFLRPTMKMVDSLTLSRDIYLEDGGCRIEDYLSGDLMGKSIVFSVRSLPSAVIRLQGLTERRSVTGWGSDGEQRVGVYEERISGPEIRYDCRIGPR
jgi:hypothetical protein